MQSGKRGRDQGRNGNVHNPRTRATPVWGDTVAGLDGCPHATDRVTSPRLATACRSCPNYNGPAGFRITSTKRPEKTAVNQTLDEGYCCLFLTRSEFKVDMNPLVERWRSD